MALDCPTILGDAEAAETRHDAQIDFRLANRLPLRRETDGNTCQFQPSAKAGTIDGSNNRFIQRLDAIRKWPDLVGAPLRPPATKPPQPTRECRPTAAKNRPFRSGTTDLTASSSVALANRQAQLSEKVRGERIRRRTIDHERGHCTITVQADHWPVVVAEPHLVHRFNY